MIMKIVDKYGMVRDILNPTFIPRMGEAIIWRYNPPPIVSQVAYNFDKDEVMILLG